MPQRPVFPRLELSTPRPMPRAWMHRLAALGVALTCLAGCADGGEAKQLTPPPPAPDTTEAEQRVHPLLRLDSPARGTFEDSGQVTVSGTATANSAPLSNLLVADVEVPIAADGAFTTTVALQPGPNLIGLRLNADDGGRAVDAVSVFGGPVHPPGTMLDNAMALHMGPTFLDDNEPDIDDLARVIEVMLEDDAFLAGFTGQPYELSSSTITMTAVDFSAVGVDVVPGTDCLAMTFVVGEQSPGAGGSMKLQFDVTGAAAVLGEKISLDATSVTIDARVCLSMGEDGVVAIEVRDAAITSEGFVLATDLYPNLATEEPETHDFLREIFGIFITDWMTTSMGDMVRDMIAAFDLSYAFGESPTITAAFDHTGISVTPKGLELVYAASFTAPQGLAIAPLGAGSLRTDDPPLAVDFSAQPLAVALSDDAVNQLFFAFWWGGAVTAFQIPPETVAALPEVFQPVAQLDLGLRLPPTLMTASQPEYSYDVAIGGVNMDVLAGSDRWFRMGIHARTGVDLLVNEQGLLDIDMDDRAQRITVHANVDEVPAGLDKGDVAALLRLMVPTILGEAQMSFAGFPVPAFSPSDFGVGVAALADVAITFAPTNIGKAGTGGGYVIAEGRAVETTAP